MEASTAEMIRKTSKTMRSYRAWNAASTEMSSYSIGVGRQPRQSALLVCVFEGTDLLSPSKTRR